MRLRVFRSVTSSCLGLALLVALPTAAAADWLVTTDGGRIETRGPWKVRGEMVVFTAAGGTLSSLRLSDCDLDASRRATAAAAAPRAPAASAPAPRKRPAMVLTDADVNHARPATPAPRQRPAPTPEAASDSGAEVAEESGTAARVVVTGWAPRDVETGSEIRGQIANVSSEIAASIRLVAVFLDTEGEILGTQPGALSATTLRPGQRSDFQVVADDVYGFSTVEFELDHLALMRQALPKASEDPAFD